MDTRYQSQLSIMRIRKRQLAYVHKNREVNETLLATKYAKNGLWVCQKCSYASECKREFSFHHTDPNKKTDTFASLLIRGNFTLDKINEEGVVFWCENCHRLMKKVTNRPCVIKAMEHNINILKNHGFKEECAMCYRRFPFRVYEFHHILPKHFNVSRLTQRMTTSELLLIEAAKCVLLCSCCHRRVDCGLGPVFTTNCLNKNFGVI